MEKKKSAANNGGDPPYSDRDNMNMTGKNRSSSLPKISPERNVMK